MNENHHNGHATHHSAAHAAPQHNDPVVSSETANFSNYNSNPFTLGFDGMSRMFKYAQGIAITIIVLSMLSFVANMFSGVVDLASTSSDIDSSQQMDNQDNDFGETIQRDVLGISTTAAAQNNDEFPVVILGAVIFIAIVFFVIYMIFAPLLATVFKGTIAAAGNAAAEGRVISFGDALATMGNHFGALYVGELISTLKIVGGYLLFIVPGVRAQLRYRFLPNLIIAENISGTAGLARAKQLANGHLLELFGIQTASSIVPIVGGVMSAGANALSYNQINYLLNNNLPNPKVHWLNYLGFILFAVVMLGLILLSVLIAVLFTAFS